MSRQSFSCDYSDKNNVSNYAIQNDDMCVVMPTVYCALAWCREATNTCSVCKHFLCLHMSHSS